MAMARERDRPGVDMTMTAVALASPAQTAPTSPPIRHRWLRPGWPLTALYLGFPLWWVLGLSHVIFLVLAVPMAMALLRRTRLTKPPLFRTLLLFLVWMLAGVTVLWAKAPGTVTNDSLHKLVPFFYWAGWYIACTIVLLYVLNLREEDLPSGSRLVRLLGFLFDRHDHRRAGRRFPPHA